jgi:hypothetical protein
MRKRHFLLCILIVVAMVRPASAQNIDPALQADITRLVDLLRVPQMAEQMGDVIAQQMVASVRREHPDVPPRVVTMASEIVKAKFVDAFSAPNGLLSRLEPVYAKYYTREEIQALIAFYQSDVGRKSITVMPAIFQDSMTLGQQWAAEVTPQITRDLEKRLRAEGIQ